MEREYTAPGKVLVIALFLGVSFIIFSCQLTTEPGDLGAPVPGNAGILLITEVQRTSVTLSWAKATDDKSKQNTLEYKAVYSPVENIASLDAARTNGTTAMDWTRDATGTEITGLEESSTIYFNVLVRDETGNESAYVMASLQSEPRVNTPPVPGNGGELTISELESTSLMLSWAEAADDHTLREGLEYRVVMATDDNIATPETANTNGVRLRDWTAAIHRENVAGLEAGQTYYFNVLVRDDSGAVSAYTMIDIKTPDTAIAKIFWADNGLDLVLSANLDGSGIDTLLSNYRMNITTPNYLAIDRKRHKLYLTDWSTDRIVRMNFDGSDPSVIVSNPDVNGPVGIAFDQVGDRLFFLDQFTDILNRSAPDGSLIEPIVSGILNTGYGLAIDELSRKMYWTDWGDTLVYQAGLDGLGRTVLLDASAGIRRPLGIAVDSIEKRIYFTDASTDILYRMDSDGSGLEEIVTGLNFPIECDLDLKERKLYWIDSGTKVIERANPDGSGREVLKDMSGTGANPYAIAVWNP